MQKKTNPNPFSGWKDGYDPSPATTSTESRSAGNGDPRVTGCPVLPQGLSGRRPGDFARHPRGRGGTGAALPSSSAPAPTAASAAATGRGRAAPPRGAPGRTGAPRPPHLGGHHGQRGACRDLPAPPPAPALPPPRAATASGPAQRCPGARGTGAGTGALLGSGIRVRVTASSCASTAVPCSGDTGARRSGWAGRSVYISVLHFSWSYNASGQVASY